MHNISLYMSLCGLSSKHHLKRPFPARLTVQLYSAAHIFPEAEPAARPRAALYATLVETQDHYKEQNFVVDAMRLKCSADRLGERLPFHIIYGGGLMAAGRWKVLL